MFKRSNSVRGASEQLAETFKRLIPLPSLQPRGGNAPTSQEPPKTSAESLAKFYEFARAERNRLGLGVLGLARVAFGLQQNLLAAGYPPQLVKQVLFAMLASALIKQR